jgi:hypothetical protein
MYAAAAGCVSVDMGDAATSVERLSLKDPAGAGGRPNDGAGAEGAGSFHPSLIDDTRFARSDPTGGVAIGGVGARGAGACG